MGSFDIFCIVAVLPAVCLIVLLVRRLWSWSNSASGSRIMEAISSTMMLSEVDPLLGAQVHIVTVMTFVEKLRFVDFRERFVENVIMTDCDSRFLDRMDCSGSFPVWTRASEWHPFDNCRSVGGVQDMVAVQSLVNRRLVEPLDVKAPPWEVCFLESVSRPDGSTGSGVILTMHHSMGDGFTLCHQLMRRCASADPQLSMQQCYPFQAPLKRGRSVLAGFGDIPGILSAAVKLLLLTPDPVSALRNSTTRRMTDPMVCEMAELPLSVAQLKELAGKVTHEKITLNDLVVAACSSALGDLLKTRHDVTGAIWVGLNRRSPLERPLRRTEDWGNQNLGVCYMPLPTGESDISKILTKSHHRLAQLKNSPEPLVANKLMKLIGSIPQAISRPLRHILMDKMSTSISNFPGPLYPIKIPVAPDGLPNKQLAGVGTLKEVFFLVAPPFSYGPYITLVSYAGKMYLAVSVAEKLMSQETVTDLVKRRIPKAFEHIANDLT